MIEYQLKNKEFIMFSYIIYEKIQKMGLNLVEREQEYARMVNLMPNHLRRKDDPFYRPIMKNPTISMDESDTDTISFDESNNDDYEGYIPGRHKITFMKRSNGADIA